MTGRPRIIVSMTSYPARIKNVPMSIFALRKLQTRPPDEIHLWLAEPEFPMKAQNLPSELNVMIKAELVFLHWLPINTYVHKRHQIFKIVDPSDLVFLMDDDVIYDQNLISKVIQKHTEYPNSIINYNHYNDFNYNGETDVWCGQSMIPAYLYPHDALKDSYQQFLIDHHIKSDEVYLNRWIKKLNIHVYNELRCGWGTLIDNTIGYHSGHAPREKRAVWIKLLNECIFNAI